MLLDNYKLIRLPITEANKNTEYLNKKKLKNIFLYINLKN